MQLRQVTRFGLALAAVVGLAALGQTGKGTAEKRLEKVPIKTQANVASGAELFKAHCASCHGLDGKGGGPVADSMKMRPTDLTQLKKRGGGKFPTYRVEQLLGGSDEIGGHGSKQMPVWGPVFRQLNRDTALAALRVRNLVAHVESMQEK